MKHLILIIYLIILAAGISTSGYFFFIYAGYKNKLTQYYALFLLSVTFHFLAHTVMVYILANTVYNDFTEHVILLILFSVSGVLMTFSLPIFFYKSSGIVFTKKHSLIFSILSIIIVILYILLFFSMINAVFSIIINTLFLINSIHCLIIMTISLKKEKDPILLKIKKVFLTISWIFTPFLPLDSINMRFNAFPNGFYVFPLFYSFLIVFSIYYKFKYLSGNKNKFELNINKIFIDKYSVTKRECEIISLIVKGRSYEEIADQLSISMPTVKTHVSNIYRKIGIKNKIELINSVKECSLLINVD